VNRPDPDLADSPWDDETVAGVDPEEVRAALRQAWRELLGVDAVTASSNFYSEGATSLTAVLLVAKMQHHGANVRLAELVARKTFAEQLDLFTAGRSDGADPRANSLLPVQRLRLAQIARQVKAGGTAPVKPLALMLEITGEVDRDLLAQSMVELVRRHDVLNTGFLNREGEIAPTRTAVADTWKPERIDLSEFSREQALDRVWQLVAETAKQGLAFDTTPLILGAVATVRPDVSIAILVVDHLVCDAESLDILFNDLVEIFSAKAGVRPPHLPDLSTPAQVRLVEAERYSVDDWPILVKKWRDLIDGYPQPPSFDLLGTIGGRDYRLTVPSLANTVTFELPAETAMKLTATYRHLGLSPLSVMLAATYLAAHIVSGAQDICLVNPRSRRNTVTAMHVVNDFAEPSVIRIRQPGTSCPCELTLAEVAAMAASSYAAASELEIPFDMIKEFATDAGISTARSLIGSAMRAIEYADASAGTDDVLPWLWCSYSKSGPRSRRMGEAVATSIDAPVHSAIGQPNLWVYIFDSSQGIRVEVIAPEKLYESTVVSEFGAALARILRTFGESPDERLATSGPAPCLATTTSIHSHDLAKGRGR
jgi:aryl carrier-like protein